MPLDMSYPEPVTVTASPAGSSPVVLDTTSVWPALPCPLPWAATGPGVRGRAIASAATDATTEAAASRTRMTGRDRLDAIVEGAIRLPGWRTRTAGGAAADRRWTMSCRHARGDDALVSSGARSRAPDRAPRAPS